MNDNTFYFIDLLKTLRHWNSIDSNNLIIRNYGIIYSKCKNIRWSGYRWLFYTHYKTVWKSCTRELLQLFHWEIPYFDRVCFVETYISKGIPFKLIHLTQNLQPNYNIIEIKLCISARRIFLMRSVYIKSNLCL